MGGKPDETSAVGSAVTVEQPAYFTGVFVIGVNVRAGEAVGVAVGDDGVQAVRRKKTKREKDIWKKLFELHECSVFRCHCPAAFFNSSNEVIHAMRLIKSASDLL